MTENKSFPYDMGNAGDFIKHGALTLFVQWWCENNPTKTLRFADPFGGCPREVLENDEIKRRLNKLASFGADANGFDSAAIAECLWDGKHYYNSGNIVRRAANKYGKPPEVWTSDVCIQRREQLALEPNFHILDSGKFDGYQCDNGYSILPHAEKFDLVLIDQFGNFLPCETKRGFPILNQIKGIAETPAQSERNVCVAVFVLDMCDNHVHKNYVKFKNENLQDIVISLRCPKILDCKVKGEKKYNVEMLLISKAFANGGGGKLRERLAKFQEAAGKALFPHGDKKIDIWGG